jgi:hypothetical protein
MTDLDEEARRILHVARAARTPSPTDKARIERRLGVLLGASALTTAGVAAAQAGSAGGAAKSLGAVAAIKWLLGGGAVIGAALGGYLSISPATPEPVVPQAPTAAASGGPADNAPAQSTAGEPTQAAVEPPPEAAASDSLGAEVELLHRAQAAWRRHDARGALALLEAHRARYPRSKLELERDALRVLTLCELGRRDDAAPVAQAFLARAPRSPLRASVEESCALR